VKGWTTRDKKPTLEVYDEKNNITYVIKFGKNAKLSVIQHDDNIDNEEITEILIKNREILFRKI
jgi:hypothetical protein